MIGVIIQARCESIRFPNKVLAKIGNYTCIEFLIKRLSYSTYVDNIIVATSKNKANKNLIKILKKNKINYFVGSENNVLERYFKVAKKYKLKTIVRITGDSPLIDYRIVDKFIECFLKEKIDYLSDSSPETYPDGMDVEVFNFKSLDKIYKIKSSSYQKEHVTPLLRTKKFFKKKQLKFNKNFSFLRITLDEKNDLKTIKNIVSHFSPRIDFSLNEIISLYKKNLIYFFQTLIF